MSIKTKEEILSTMKDLLKDDTSDMALSILEDVSDTFDDFQSKAEGDGTDWKKKYEDNDNEWRQKYRDRFFNHSADDPDDDIETPDDHVEKVKFEELFSQEGEK